MIRSRPWKEFDTPAERIADRRLRRVLNLQQHPTRRIVRWSPEDRRLLLGQASKHQLAGACRWRRVLRIKRLVRAIGGAR